MGLKLSRAVPGGTARDVSAGYLSSQKVSIRTTS